jgi:VWFA-related protein
MRVDQSVIEKRIQSVPATGKERIDTLKAQFKAAGCAPDMIQEQAVPAEELPNLICIIPGADPGAIVVGTRLESKAKGEEAVVDWGGPVMLPLLAESLNSAPHHQTFIFVAFAGQEHGQAGAVEYLKQLNDEQRAQLDAMVQIDKVGRTPANYAFPEPDTSRVSTGGRRSLTMGSGHPPTTLSKVLPLAATSLKLTDPPPQNNEIPATEARVFQEANIPSIVIHSPSYTVLTIAGRMEPVRLARTAIDPKVYSDTYNLMCVYLLYLDKVYFMSRSKAAATQVAKAEAPAGSSSAAAPAAPGAITASVSDPAGSAAPPAGTSAQPAQISEPSSTNPVFRTTARLVQVDVVVTDKQGKPVSGLSQSDFTVMQDGKPQKVRVFEPHTGNAVAEKSDQALRAPKLPPDTYSNHPNAATSDSWTIVLYDVLNTPTPDQEYARKQLLALLRNVPKGRPVALYVLTNRLVMVQGFTDEPEQLMKAAENLRPSRSHVLTTEAQRQQEVGQVTAATAELMANAPSGTTNDNALINQMNSDRLQQTRDLESFQVADRANFTLAAFEALSRAVSGYPGRKNLIWLSASFPVQIMADPKQETQPWRNASNYRTALAEAGVLLSKSRIAVYPTDVRGLQGRGVDISVTANESAVYTGAQNAPAYGDLIGQQTAAYTEERTTMKQIAEQTGGEAFVGTNDLKLAMQRSMDDGSTYYTLAYTPDKIDPQTAFHKIDVKVNHPDVKLAYRRGYYSQGQKAPAPAVGAAALRGALQPGMPPATMVFFNAMVLPPDATHKDVRIQYVVNPNTITFEDVADQKKRIVLDCIAIAYDKEGREVAHSSDTLDGAIQAAAYETVMARGVPAKQEISLPAGIYNLRLGVMDRASQQIGTLDVPLVVPDSAVAARK